MPSSRTQRWWFIVATLWLGCSDDRGTPGNSDAGAAGSMASAEGGDDGSGSTNGGSPSSGGTAATGGTPTGGQASGGTSGDGSADGGISQAGSGAGDTPSAGAESGGAAENGGASEAGSPSTSGSPGTAGWDLDGTLPEGDVGIARTYEGDQGIEQDAAVVFSDDFEAYAVASDLNQRWDAVYQNQYVGLATTPENVYDGQQALEFTLPQQDAELSDATDKLVNPELDVLFLRYYSKFQPPYDVVGSSHNGSSISAHYFDKGNATPGVPADGTNKFLANLENWRGEAETASPGLLNIYIYHPEQRSQWGDHFFPNGGVMPNTSLLFDFGPDFISREQLIPELDRWYCYELMVKANTPGERDGRIAFWLDGELKGDFPNLRLRDVESLKIDRFGLSYHIYSNPSGESKKWYDNVVAARAYIGPLWQGE